jgi:hypothetical protein
MAKQSVLLLWKAQVRPIQLKPIFLRRTEQEKTGFRLSEETADQWKVELAVEAMWSILDEILKAHKYLEEYVDYSTLTTRHLDRESGYRPLLPLALGGLLQGKAVGEVLNESRGGGYRRRAGGEANITSFLGAFREWADNAAKGGQVPSFDEVLAAVDGRLRDLVPSETIRRHIATVASDILKLVSVPLDRIDEPVDRKYNEIVSSGRDIISFLSKRYWERIFPESEDLQDLAFRMFSWVALLQHIVNRLVGGWAHSLWRTVASDERFASEEKPTETYLPVFWWAAHFPGERQRLSISSSPVTEEVENVFEVLPLMGAVSVVGGRRYFPNMGGGWRIARQVEGAIRGDFPKERDTEAEIQRRDLPSNLMGVARNFLVVLEYLRSIFEKEEEKEKVVGRLQSLPTTREFVNSLLQRSGSSPSQLVETLKRMMSEVRQLMRAYWDEAKRIDEAPIFLAALDSIFSGQSGVGVDIHRAKELVEKINRMIVELASLSPNRWREILDGSLVPESGGGFLYQVLKLYYGSYTPFLGLPSSSQRRDIDEAVRSLVDAVIDVSEKLSAMGSGESVGGLEDPKSSIDQLKHLKSLIDRVVGALKGVRDVVIREARRGSRTFLLQRSGDWDSLLDRWIGGLSEWSKKIDEFLKGGENLPSENIGNIAAGARTALGNVVDSLKKMLFSSWSRAAVGTAERLIDLLNDVQMDRDAVRAVSWLLGAARATVGFERIAEERAGEGEGEGGEEGGFVVSVEDRPLSVRLEEALSRLVGFVAELWAEGYGIEEKLRKIEQAGGGAKAQQEKQKLVERLQENKREVRDKFLSAINGMIEIFSVHGIGPDEIRRKLLNILTEIEVGSNVPSEVARWVRNAEQREGFVWELKAILLSPLQQMEPSVSEPSSLEEVEEKPPEEEEPPEEGEEPPAAPGAEAPSGSGEDGAAGEDDEEREGSSGEGGWRGERFLLAKFYLLAKALRAVP